MSGNRHHTDDAAVIAGDTAEHATNPLVAGYDIIDFLTTIAFVTANVATTLNPIVPVISNVLHILNYSLLGYIQAKGLNTLGRQQALDEIQHMRGAITSDEQLAIIRKELLPPEKDRKSEAEFMWDLVMYILKMTVCIFLTTISVLSIALITGTAAAIVNGALLPIGYVITTGINVLKFGKNTLKGIYDYFFKGRNSEHGSDYQRYHAIVDNVERKLASKHFEDTVSDAEISEYVDARNAIRKAGRDNIQNGIFLGLSSSFFSASILLVLASSVLMTAALPPLATTIASALFVGAGIVFAIHGISVLANVIRKNRGQPEKETFFGWITDKLYPAVTKDELKEEYAGKIAPATAVVSSSAVILAGVDHQDTPAVQPPKEKMKITAFALCPSWNGFSGSFYASQAETNPAIQHEIAHSNQLQRRF